MQTLIVLCGPTGIGKTPISIQLAQHLRCEILSADSRQVFREMRIGTAVPSIDELSSVAHHFIRSHSVHNGYNASQYEQEVLRFLSEHFKSCNTILMVGGSGLYIDAVCRGIDDLPSIKPAVRKKWRELFESKGLSYIQEKVREFDPEYYEKVDRQNHKRLLKALEVYEQTGLPYTSFLKNTAKERPFRILKMGLNTAREQLYKQINDRVDRMVQQGLEEEARQVLPWRGTAPLQTVGYTEFFQYFDGVLSRDEAIRKIKDHSRAYARRQLTWFRKDPDIEWFDPDALDEMISWLDKNLIKRE